MTTADRTSWREHLHRMKGGCTHSGVLCSGKETGLVACVCLVLTTMKYFLDAAVMRRDAAMTRRSMVRRGEVHGDFAAYHPFDAAMPPRDAAVCGAPTNRTRRVHNVTRRILLVARQSYFGRDGESAPHRHTGFCSQNSRRFQLLFISSPNRP